jgi:hypothetical protein
VRVSEAKRLRLFRVGYSSPEAYRIHREGGFPGVGPPGGEVIDHRVDFADRPLHALVKVRHPSFDPVPECGLIPSDSPIGGPWVSPDAATMAARLKEACG